MISSAFPTRPRPLLTCVSPNVMFPGALQRRARYMALRHEPAVLNAAAKLAAELDALDRRAEVSRERDTFPLL